MAKNANTKKASEKIEVAKITPEETQPVVMDSQQDETRSGVETEAEQPTIQSTAAPVIPDYGYSRLMQFPAEVILPMHVVVDIGISNRRYQIFNNTQEVPKPIIDWLKSDARYVRWFA